jgi:hypothetical protein
MRSLIGLGRSFLLLLLALSPFTSFAFYWTSGAVALDRADTERSIVHEGHSCVQKPNWSMWDVILGDVCQPQENA